MSFDFSMPEAITAVSVCGRTWFVEPGSVSLNDDGDVIRFTVSGLGHQMQASIESVDSLTSAVPA